MEQQEADNGLRTFLKIIIHDDRSKNLFFFKKISSPVMKKFAQRFLTHVDLDSYQQGKYRRNWREEWKGHSRLLRHLSVEDMKYALCEQSKLIKTVTDRTNLKTRFKMKFQMSHPLVECLFYKEAICYLVGLGFLPEDNIDMNKLDHAK